MTEPTLQEQLREYAGNHDDDCTVHVKAGELREAADALDAAQAEIVRLQDRLEMRHAWRIIDGQKVRVEVEPGSIPDGIDCRNETIKLQDEHCLRLGEEIAALRLEADAAGSRITGLEAMLADAQAEVERLREALEKICEPITVAADAETVVACQDLHDLICDIAQTALGRTP